VLRSINKIVKKFHLPSTTQIHDFQQKDTMSPPQYWSTLKKDFGLYKVHKHILTLVVT